MSDIMTNNLSAIFASLPGSLGYIPEPNMAVIGTFLTVHPDSERFAQAAHNATRDGQQYSPDQPFTDPEQEGQPYQTLMEGLPVYAVATNVFDHAELIDTARMKAISLVEDVGLLGPVDADAEQRTQLMERVIDNMECVVVINDEDAFERVAANDGHLYRIYETLAKEDTSITMTPPAVVAVTKEFATGAEFYAINVLNGMDHIHGHIGDIENTHNTRMWRREHNFAALPVTAEGAWSLRLPGDDTVAQADTQAAAIAEYVLHAHSRNTPISEHEIGLDTDVEDITDEQRAVMRAADAALKRRSAHLQHKLIAASRALIVLNGTNSAIDGKDLRVVLELIALMLSYSKHENILSCYTELPVLPLILGDVAEDPEAPEVVAQLAGNQEVARIVRIALDTLVAMDFSGTDMPARMWRRIRANALLTLLTAAAVEHDRGAYIRYAELQRQAALELYEEDQTNTQMTVAMLSLKPGAMHALGSMLFDAHTTSVELLAEFVVDHPLPYDDLDPDIIDDIADVITRNTVQP